MFYLFASWKICVTMLNSRNLYCSWLPWLNLWVHSIFSRTNINGIRSAFKHPSVKEVKATPSQKSFHWNPFKSMREHMRICQGHAIFLFVFKSLLESCYIWITWSRAQCRWAAETDSVARNVAFAFKCAIH